MKKNQKKKKIFRFKNHEIFVNTVVMAISFILVFLLFIQTTSDQIYDLASGDVAKKDIYLTKDVVDKVSTQAIKSRAAQSIEPIMVIDFNKQVESKKQLNDFFGRLLELKESYSSEPELLKRVYAGIEQKNSFGFDDKTLHQISTLSVERIALLKNYSMDLTQEYMSGGIDINDIKDIDSNIETFVENISELSQSERQILSGFIKGSVKVNKFIDQDETEKKIQAELEKIDDVVFAEGTLLISKGDTVTERQIEILNDGDMLIKSGWHKFVIWFGIIGFLVGIWTINHLYLLYFEYNILESSKKYIILMVMFVSTLASSTIFAPISPYLIPIPVFAMLVGILLTPNLVKLYGTTLIVLISILVDLPMEIALMYILGLLTVSIFLRNIKLRSQIMMIAIYTSMAMFVFIFTEALFHNKLNERFLFDSLFIFGNGILSSVITLGTLPFFESIFNVLTPFKLLELSNPNRDLLKRLLVEAPGTYHHSILVGNLSETAAHDIGANSMLARVGSFYHDIGKLESPYYFKENQIAHENPHDKLPPQVSANIIRNHTVFGVELAEKNKLPEEILQIIREHHGTSLIKYFYHQEKTKNASVDISKFLYHGPRPVSKEAVIVMLADSVEAAVRTIDMPTKESIGELVDKIFGQKIAEEQLNNSNITLKELVQIKKSFIKVLGGIFHERIVYPEVDMSDIAKEAFNDSPKKKEGDKRDDD